MTPRQQEVLELVRQRGPMSSAAIAADLGISPLTASNHLNALKHARAVTPSGLGPGAVWSAGVGQTTKGAGAGAFSNAADIFSAAARMGGA